MVSIPDKISNCSFNIQVQGKNPSIYEVPTMVEAVWLNLDEITSTGFMSVKELYLMEFVLS